MIFEGLGAERTPRHLLAKTLAEHVSYMELIHQNYLVLIVSENDQFGGESRVHIADISGHIP